MTKDKNLDYPVWWALDIIDPRDYVYRVRAWWNKLDTLSKKIINLESDYQNQWLNVNTRMWCVFYGSWHSNNNNKYTKEVDNLSLCNIAIKKWLLDIKKWAYVSSWPKLLKQLWIINWYLLTLWLDNIIDAINNGSCIVAWSKKINWRKTEQNNWYAIINKWSAHIFSIIWYDNIKKILICKNSYWKHRYNKWNFFINYKDINCLFYSKYSLVYKKKDMNEIINDRINELMPIFKEKAKENQIARVEQLKADTPSQALSYMMYIVNNRKEKYIIDDILYYLKNKWISAKKWLINVYNFIVK